MSKQTRCPTSGKFTYPSFETAIHVALISNRRRGIPLRPYECGCGGWHLTKRPGNPAVATRPGPFTPTDLARIIHQEEPRMKPDDIVTLTQNIAEAARAKARARAAHDKAEEASA